MLPPKHSFTPAKITPLPSPKPKRVIGRGLPRLSTTAPTMPGSSSTQSCNTPHHTTPTPSVHPDPQPPPDLPARHDPNTRTTPHQTKPSQHTLHTNAHRKQNKAQASTYAQRTRRKKLAPPVELAARQRRHSKLQKPR